MHLLQVTLGSGATPIIPPAVTPNKMASFSVFIIQNNATHSIRVGDSTVSSTRGILLASGTPGGSQTITPALQYTGDLSEFYLFGTAGDVIDLMIFD